MWQGKAKILINQELTPGYFQMSLWAPEIVKSARPGQFVHLKVGESCDPLLRRPLSLHRIGGGQDVKHPEEAIELLYEVVGRGTCLLSEKQAGEEIDLLGPLGQGFIIPEELTQALLVAGGMGVAPFLALVEELKAKEAEKIYAFLGARTKALVLDEEALAKRGVRVSVTTEDGSYGHKGLPTELLEKVLDTLQGTTLVYACGPWAMLQEVARISAGKKVSCQVSLDNQLACGVGACQGCVVEVKSKTLGAPAYQRVCREGPVFSAEELVWK